MRQLVIWSLVCIAVIGTVLSCTHKVAPTPTVSDGNFPPEIASIFINKCAVAGCHNAASYGNNDSVLLDSWEHLFNGGNNGAVVVPYSPQYSLLLYCVNTDSSLGQILLPTMPFSTPGSSQGPLSKTEYLTLYNWISQGAPDKNGNIPFADNANTRQKIYLTQQGCDLMAVIDPIKKVVTRYLPIGMSAAVEAPHCVRFSDDGKHAYVSFINGDYVQQIDASTDQIINSVDVATNLLQGGQGGSWNILYPSPGKDTALMVSDWQGFGAFAYLNITGLNIVSSRSISPVTTGGFPFVYPHGITSNAGFDTFFVTAQYGNTIYKVVQNSNGVGEPVSLSLNGQPANTTNNNDISSPNPHEILMAPDYNKYFVTCQSTNEVKVMDAHTDAVLNTIPVGTFPQEMALAPSKHLLFVTCMEDASNNLVGRRGSVYVIDYNTMAVVKIIYGDFYQPHGICVDERDGLILIASTNANPNGPAPHHASACGGRDGWYTFYDLNTLAPAINKRYEVTVMPYSAAVRFK